MEDPTVVSTITGALTGAGPQLLQIGGAALGVGLIVLLLTRGWGLVKRFTK
jgi:hypothetical protein